MGYKMRVTGDTNPHFPGDGYETITSTTAGMAASAASYTSTTATVTGGGTVPALGTKGMAITAGGWYAPYVVTTSGANGAISVDFWRNPDPTKNGQVPTGNLTLHNTAASTTGGSIAATFQRTIIKSLNVETSVAGTITLKDVAGTTLSVITLVGATAQPIFLEWDDETYRFRGPVSVTLSAGGIMATIGFDLELPLGNPLIPLA